VFYLQLVDAELLSPPLLSLGAPSPAEEEIGKTVNAMHVDGQQPRMTWSRNSRFVNLAHFLSLSSLIFPLSHRLFPEEQSRGGYMPVSDVYKAFLQLGFEGFVRCVSSPPSLPSFLLSLTLLTSHLLLPLPSPRLPQCPLPLSLELFTRFIQLSDSSIPTEHAERGWKSWEAIHKKLGIEL
jgi:hypothetical protein